MAVTSDENNPVADNEKDTPEGAGNTLKPAEANASYHEDVRFQITNGDEKRSGSNKNGIVLLIIVSVLSIAVGAAGGIFAYRETLGPEPSTQTQVPVVEGQNQEDLGSSSSTTTMSSDLADQFYDELEQNEEDNGGSIHQTGLLPVTDSQIVDHRYLACGFDFNVCAWSSATNWDVTTHSVATTHLYNISNEGYLLYNSSSANYNEAVLISKQVNNSHNAYCLLILFRSDMAATLSVMLVHGDSFNQLWEEPGQEESWQLLRLNISIISEMFQVFIIAKDPQFKGVQVNLDYTDLRPESCKSSMTVQEVPDILRVTQTEAPPVNQGLGLLRGLFLPPANEEPTGTPTNGNSFLGSTGWGFGGLPSVEDTAAEEPQFDVGDIALHSTRNRLVPNKVDFSDISCTFDSRCDWLGFNHWELENKTLTEATDTGIKPSGKYAYLYVPSVYDKVATMSTHEIRLYDPSTVFCFSFKFYKTANGLLRVYLIKYDEGDMIPFWLERNPSSGWRMAHVNITSSHDFVILVEASEMKDNALVAVDDIVLTNTTCRDTPASQDINSSTTPASIPVFDMSSQ